MMVNSIVYAVAGFAACAGATSSFDPTQHLGGNSPWFPGPNVFGISNEVPEGCSVDTAAFISRHGSRYPDPGAYNGWVSLAAKFQAAKFTASGSLKFIKSWQPVLDDPDQQLQKLSPGGWKELYDMGVYYRYRYPQLYENNTPFELFANRYLSSPRVIDSARLFARGFLGPNATTLGSIHVLDASDPQSVANSLGPSDLCPTYKDASGGAAGDSWAAIYLPPITKRLNKLLKGDLVLTDSDVSTMPYLCGFETQITGRKSQWCDVLTRDEIEKYEYAQDLRYWYGVGLGSGKNATMMLPVLNAIVQRLQDGPGRTYRNSKGENWTPPALIAMFANDGQINQLASQIGVFDKQQMLSGKKMSRDRVFVASRYSSMRGTVSFERLNCKGNKKYVRILLNDAVYPVPSCQNGPGRSCPLDSYASLIAGKTKKAGSFNEVCKLKSDSPAAIKSRATFLVDNALAWETTVAP